MLPNPLMPSSPREVKGSDRYPCLLTRPTSLFLLCRPLAFAWVLCINERVQAAAAAVMVISRVAATKRRSVTPIARRRVGSRGVRSVVRPTECLCCCFIHTELPASTVAGLRYCLFAGSHQHGRLLGCSSRRDNKLASSVNRKGVGCTYCDGKSASSVGENVAYTIQPSVAVPYSTVLWMLSSVSPRLRLFLGALTKP